MFYLDYNATTPTAPEVAEAMLPFLTGMFANPASGHALGRAARATIEKAREQTAALIGAKPDEIVFNSGGTEANNTVIKGVLYSQRAGKRHVITSVVEHGSILQSVRHFEQNGWQVTRIGVDREGRFDPDDVRRAITPNTALISLMHAQNEVGTIESIAEIGRIAREAEVLFHCDTAQSLGKVPVDVNAMHVDLLTIAGHKIYGPKGVGALYIREGVSFEPLLHGVGHEAGRRSGSQSALLIVGLGAASASAVRFLADETNGPDHMRRLRDDLLRLLQEKLGSRVQLNGHPTLRVPNTLNVSFDGWYSADLLARLDNICASTGSACHAGSRAPSPVLSAMGLSDERAAGGVRFSLGRHTTSQEIQTVAAQITDVVCKGQS